MEPTMERASLHRPAGQWPAEQAVDSVTLDFDRRHRRRLRLVTDAGAPLLLDLERTAVLCHGDGLQTERGSWVRVEAAAEPLLEIRARDAQHLARLAWHVGNRHVPAEVGASTLRIRPDHVIAGMLANLGADVREILEPFLPERGAYAEDHERAH